MFVALPGFLGSAGGGPPPPPPGTLLSSHCSGYSAQDAGAEDYTDANGAIWNGMFTTWQQIADGTGGSYWQSLGNNSSDIYSSCWYPNGFCLSNYSSDNYVNWEGCGSSGSFGPTSYSYNIVFADGSGGTYGDSGGGQYDPPSSGAVIYQSGEDNCCTVYYDGNNGYYITDTCGGGYPPEGTLLSSRCAGYTSQDAGAEDYTDASGSIFGGTFTLWEEIANGSGGSTWNSIGNNASDVNVSCWLPFGFKFDYSSYSYSLDWTVSDSGAMTQASGNYNYANGWSSSSISDGSGGTFSDGYSWSATSGDLIANGTYYDANYGQDWYYYVYYDGMGGFYTNQYPV